MRGFRGCGYYALHSLAFWFNTLAAPTQKMSRIRRIPHQYCTTVKTDEKTLVSCQAFSQKLIKSENWLFLIFYECVKIFQKIIQNGILGFSVPLLASVLATGGYSLNHLRLEYSYNTNGGYVEFMTFLGVGAAIVFGILGN